MVTSFSGPSGATPEVNLLMLSRGISSVKQRALQTIACSWFYQMIAPKMRAIACPILRLVPDQNKR
jgi:hypothetical protein